MSAEPEIGGRRPIADRCRGRRELLVVRLRALEDAAVLRRLAQGHRVPAAGMEGDGERGSLVLRLQALHHTSRSHSAMFSNYFARPRPVLAAATHEVDVPRLLQTSTRCVRSATARFARGATGRPTFWNPFRLDVATSCSASAHRHSCDPRAQAREGKGYVMPDLLLEFSPRKSPRACRRGRRRICAARHRRLVPPGWSMRAPRRSRRRGGLRCRCTACRRASPTSRREERPACRRAGQRHRRLSQRRRADLDRRGQSAARQEGRLLRRGDREAGPAGDRCDRRDFARGDQELSLAEIDALGRAVESARRAHLGAPAAFDRRHLRAGDRGAGYRAVRGRRHRGRRRDARPPLHGAGPFKVRRFDDYAPSSTRPRSCSIPSAAAT